jgi:hypothetical protein
MSEETPEIMLHRNIEDLHVKDIYNCYDVEPSIVTKGDPVWKMVAALITRPSGRNVYVTDAEGCCGFREVLGRPDAGGY